MMAQIAILWPARPPAGHPSHMVLHTLSMHACQSALKLIRTKLHKYVTQYVAFQVMFCTSHMLLCNILGAGT